MNEMDDLIETKDSKQLNTKLQVEKKDARVLDHKVDDVKTQLGLFKSDMLQQQTDTLWLMISNVPIEDDDDEQLIQDVLSLFGDKMNIKVGVREVTRFKAFVLVIKYHPLNVN